ncbi:MAG: dihydrofolate reductase [Candidatus Moranbacteria bacterium]|nr:dihydrofolate reductase [Candidatus Moranbacteria bacterium]
MQKPIISIIAAIGENNAIGLNGEMLWCIPEDMQNFRKLINDHCIIIGRKTFRSIGKTFTDREKIIVLSDSDVVFKNCIMASSIDDAIAKARELEKEEIFICGGGSVYAQTIDMADKLYLTVVKGNFEADVFFPKYDEFKKVVSQRKSIDENFEYTFLELEKE